MEVYVKSHSGMSNLCNRMHMRNVCFEDTVCHVKLKDIFSQRMLYIAFYSQDLIHFFCQAVGL